MSAWVGDLVRRVPRTWLVYAVALVVRLAYVSQDHPVPPQDTPDYDEIAQNLLQGEGFVARGAWHGYPMRSWRSPFYPFFLASVYGTWGFSHQAVRAVQACVDAGTVVLVYLLGCCLVPAAALPAALLAAVYGPLVSACYEVMSETWFTFWGMLALWLLLRAAGGEGARTSALLLGGAATGLAALTRPVGLLLLPAFALAAVRASGWQGVRRAAWVALGVVCVVAPWSVRNYRVHGAFVPIATHGGYIVARSNADVPDWRVPHAWGIDKEVFERVPSEVERDRLWLRQGLAWIGAHPASWLRLSAERFLRFWYFLRPEYNAWFMAVLPFFLGGLWHSRRDAAYALLRGYVGVSVLVFTFVLYGSTRFRLPLEPLFLLYAAAFVHHAAQRWGRMRTLGAVAAVVAANLVVAWQQEPLRRLILGLLAQWELR